MGSHTGQCPEEDLDVGLHFQDINRGGTEIVLKGGNVKCCSQ